MPRGPAYTRPAPLPRRGVKYTTVQKNLIKMSCVSDFPEGREATPSGSSVSLDRARASNSESAGALAPASSVRVSNSAAPEASAPASTPATRTRPPIITPKFRGLCGTAVCCIINPVSGHFCKIRILIDSGANLSLIDRALAKAVGLTGSPTVISISTADGGTKVHKEIEVVFYLATRDKSTVTRPIVAMVSDAFLNSSYASINIDPRDHEYLEGIELAEDFPSPQTRPYHLILGEPYVSFITHDRVRRPPRPDLPFACSTDLGWILKGAVGTEGPIEAKSLFSASSLEHESFDLETMRESIGFDFSKFWTGENIGLDPKEQMFSSLTALELKAEEFQRRTAFYDSSINRWTVQLPWIDEDLEAHRLTDNSGRAIAMWHKVLRRVKPTELIQVSKAYREFIDNGFVEIVPDSEMNPDHPTYVMTSRPVFRQDRATTKCRIVINASLPDQVDPTKTLNKMLMPGPNKLPQIMKLVLITTQHLCLAMVDIKKMFLAVQLQKLSDRDMLRFVWAEADAPAPNFYRFKTLPFGVVSSPFQAIWCLQEAAKMQKLKYPEAADIILNMTYMDDIIIVADSVSLTVKRLQEVLHILEHGGFYGHKISASDPRVLESLDSERTDPARTVKILGLILDHDSGNFRFNVDEIFSSFISSPKKITRHLLVSLAARVFDTQGYVSPYVMQFKKLLPMLWHNQTSWKEDLENRSTLDDSGKKIPCPVAQEAVARFKEWVEDIPKLKELQFPRFIGGPIEFVAIFGDASKTGIGVVAYAVTKADTGATLSRIIYSKSSLMPKNLREKAKLEDTLTIARAELIAMVCCVTMMDYLREAYNPLLTSDKVVIFTDSLLNLQRIQRGKGKCKPFEERRVCKVLDGKGQAVIRFCPGVENPSDLPSRGCTLTELQDRMQFWKEGPDFLKLPTSHWPKQPAVSEKIKDDASLDEQPVLYEDEIKLHTAQLIALQAEAAREQSVFTSSQVQPFTDEPFNCPRLLKRCSTLRTVRGVITRVRRFVERLKCLVRKEPPPSMTAPPSLTEIQAADLLLCRATQQQYLAREFLALRADDKLPKGSVLRDLPVYYDPDTNVIRLKTRLHTASSLTFDYSNPIIVPRSELAQQMVLEVHVTRFHASQRTTYNVLRQRYWFCGGFKYVKDLVRTSCKTPRCRYIKYMSPAMSPLPSIRIDDPQPWKNVGIDYLGPNLCKHECLGEGTSKGTGRCSQDQTFKVWQAIFTCFHTRAIHVETVTSCSTDAFLMAFRRFVGTHGRPMTFYSDKARTFTAADKQLRELLATKLTSITGAHFGGPCPVEWRYSTPTAPWANGCTERLVGIFKKQFKVMLQKHLLTLAQMQTLVIELQSSINDRPLGVTREDLDGPMITPNLLMYGREKNPLRTPGSSALERMPISEMWLRRKRVLAHFWAKWQSDYLSTLSITNKWLEQDQTLLKVGDVVILKPETLEKNQWRLARIVDLHRNLDGVLTSATVRLPSKTLLTRTLRQMALLEPAYLERDNPTTVPDTEELPEQPPLTPEEVRSEQGHVESQPEDRSRPSSSPCLETGERSSASQYPEQGPSAGPSSVPVSNEGAEGQEIPEPPRRSARKRKRQGYYKLLAEGKL